MTRPRLLDLFCGAGGCSVGFHRAGFDVTGWDLHPHPDYPYDFVQRDALEALSDTAYLRSFDALAASPPCQAWTSMSNRHRGNGGPSDTWPQLIDPTRDAFLAAGRPYILENVPGARHQLHQPLLLRGAMFGLGVDRPRLFESNVFLMVPPHVAHVRDPVGVYGQRPDGRRLFDRADGTSQHAAASLEEARDAMGIDWMTDWRDIAEAIPPAYTHYLGDQLLTHLEQAG